MHPLQIGAGLTKERVADFLNDAGDDLSSKNINHCELAEPYWIWKNKSSNETDGNGSDYCGLFHYRWILDITDEKLHRMRQVR